MRWVQIERNGEHGPAPMEAHPQARLLQVGNQILDILDSHRQSNQIIVDAASPRACSDNPA